MEPREQDVVLDVDVLDEVVPQLRSVGIERPPGAAGALRHREVASQRGDAVQHLAMIDMRPLSGSIVSTGVMIHPSLIWPPRPFCECNRFGKQADE